MNENEIEKELEQEVIGDITRGYRDYNEKL